LSLIYANASKDRELRSQLKFTIKEKPQSPSDQILNKVFLWTVPHAVIKVLEDNTASWSEDPTSFWTNASTINLQAIHPIANVCIALKQIDVNDIIHKLQRVLLLLLLHHFREEYPQVKLESCFESAKAGLSSGSPNELIEERWKSDLKKGRRLSTFKTRLKGLGPLALLYNEDNAGENAVEAVPRSMYGHSLQWIVLTFANWVTRWECKLPLNGEPFNTAIQFLIDHGISENGGKYNLVLNKLFEYQKKGDYHFQSLLLGLLTVS